MFIPGEVRPSHILTVWSVSRSKHASMHSPYLGPAFKNVPPAFPIISFRSVAISPQMLTPQPYLHCSSVSCNIPQVSLLRGFHSTVSVKILCAFNQPLSLIEDVLSVNTTCICLVNWQWKKLVNHRLTSLIFSLFQWWSFGAVPNADAQKDIMSLQGKKGRIH